MERAAALPTLQDIITVDPDEFVAKYTDIAAINMACAVGLPRSEDIDIPKYLGRLDAMAVWLRQKTARSWHVYENDPAKWNHSKNQFRVMLMLRFLHAQFGVHYNPERDGGFKHDPSDSGDVFIHGLLSERRTGTCGSLPVFAAAVGRRLGYPLKLVKVPEHLIFRWDDGTERFNVEYSGDGSSIHEDEYYHSWPVKWDDELHALNARYGVWLTSLTPRQEVAKCLETRLVALDHLGRTEEALECLRVVERFNPANPYYHGIRVNLFARMRGADNLPWVNVAPHGRRGERPNVIVSPLYHRMLKDSESCRWIHDDSARALSGPGLRVPLTCVVSAGPMFSANWYWNFVKDPPPFPIVEPAGGQLLDTLDPYRDHSGRTRLFVRMTKNWHDDEEPLYLHDMRIVSKPKQEKERG